MKKIKFDPESEKIRDAYERLRLAYARKSQVLPIVEPGIPVPSGTVHERVESLERMYDYAASYANAMAASDNGWPPFIMNYCTVPMIPEVFGCPVHFPEGHDAATRPALNDIGGVWNMKPKPLMEACTVRRMFEWVDYAQRHLGTELCFWTADIQSPFSVAAQVVQTDELLMACITDPKAVHHLCRMITDVTIDMMERHLKQLERPGFPGANYPCIPDPIGICIADDTPLIMLSAEMYREFALPYNREISGHFGGVHIHCCGNYSRNLQTLFELPGLKSIQVHAGPGEFPLPLTADEDCAFNRARRELTIFADSNSITRADQYRNQNRKHYEEYVLPRLMNGDRSGLILQACGAEGPDFTAEDGLRWTREQTISPR